MAAPAYVTGAGQAASQVDLNGVATNITYSGGKIVVFVGGATGEAATCTFGGAALTPRASVDAGSRGLRVFTGDPSNELSGVGTGTQGALVSGAGSNSMCTVIEVSGAADGDFDVILSEVSTGSTIAETVGDIDPDTLMLLGAFGQVGSIALDAAHTNIFTVAQANRSTRVSRADYTSGGTAVATSMALGATVVSAGQLIVLLKPPAPAGFTGDAAITLGALTAGAAGSLSIQGGVSGQLGALTSTAAGSLSVQASASVTLGALTGGGVGSLSITGGVSGQLADLVASGAASLGLGGAASVTLGALTCIATGQLGAVPSTGQAAITLDALTCSAGGSLSLRGSVSGQLAPLTSSAQSSLALAAAASVTLGALVCTAAGFVGQPPAGPVRLTLGPATPRPRVQLSDAVARQQACYLLA